jgi:hypothetical protein
MEPHQYERRKKAMVIAMPRAMTASRMVPGFILKA